MEDSSIFSPIGIFRDPQKRINRPQNHLFLYCQATSQAQSALYFIMRQNHSSLGNQKRPFIFLLLMWATFVPPVDLLAGEMEKPTVLLISLDAFRYDYFDKADTPNLDRLRREGLQAESLIPVFPSNTFPNHYSIVTGLYPAHSGIIDNEMYDPVYDAYFDLGKRDELASSRWWHGEPVWVTAVRQGLKANTLFWPGTEAEINGYRPTQWLPYEHNMPYPKRVKIILDWMDLPKKDRPNFLTLYLPEVNEVAHRAGADAPETYRAVELVDGAIGEIMKGLEERALLDSTHIIVVSDHGMVDVSPERQINLDDYFDTGIAQWIRYGAQVGIWAPDNKLPRILKKLKNAHPHLKVYAKDEIPERFHLSGHIRIPPIVGIPDLGWEVVTNKALSKPMNHPLRGDHGFDNQEQLMHGIFIAYGPDIPRGKKVDSFINVEIYDLLCQLLGLQPAPNDGTGWLVEQVRNLN